MWFVIIGGSMIDFPMQSRAVAFRADMHGYALMAETSEDDVNQAVNNSIKLGPMPSPSVVIPVIPSMMLYG